MQLSLQNLNICCMKAIPLQDMVILLHNDMLGVQPRWPYCRKKAIDRTPPFFAVNEPLPLVWSFYPEISNIEAECTELFGARRDLMAFAPH